MKMSTPAQHPSTKTAPAGAVFGNSLQERLLLGDICRGRRGLRHEIFVLDGLAALDDGDRQELAALHGEDGQDRKSTRLNSSHRTISYAVFCLKKKKKK